MNDYLVNGRYRMKQLVGAGSFGAVYKAVDIQTKKLVAVKVEQKSIKFAQLQYEAWLLKTLTKRKLQGFARYRHYCEDEEHRFLVMSLCGQTMETILRSRNSLSIPSTTKLAMQMIEILRDFHGLQNIHRDIKPDNIATSKRKGAKCRLYLIDFGLAKRWCDRNGRHIRNRTDRKLTGSARYASVNCHRGMEQSRRDDLESLMYVIMHMLKGSLPWQGIKLQSSDRANKTKWYNAICTRKQELRAPQFFKHFPGQFLDLYKYIRALKFDQLPDYAYMCSLMIGVAQAGNFTFLDPFDWITDGNQMQTCGTLLMMASAGPLSPACSTEKRSQSYNLVSANNSNQSYIRSLLSKDSEGLMRVTIYDNSFPHFSSTAKRKANLARGLPSVDVMSDLYVGDPPESAKSCSLM